MRYCHVIDSINLEGKIVKVIDKGPCSLPESYENITNFYLLSPSELKMYGWLPVITEGENKPVFVSSCYEILESKIVEHVTTRDYTDEEKQASEKEALRKKWQEIRSNRNALLKETDFKVLADIWERLSVEERQKISNYRQALRDIPQTFNSPEGVTFPTLN